MRSLHASQQTALELVVAMVTVWPELLPTSSDCWSNDVFPLAKTLQFVLLYWVASCSSDHGRILRRLYRWGNDLQFTSDTLTELGARLINKLNDQEMIDVCIGEGMFKILNVSGELSTIEVLHGSHIGWQNTENYLHLKEHLFPWEKESIVPAIQHGCRVKPL